MILVVSRDAVRARWSATVGVGQLTHVHPVLFGILINNGSDGRCRQRVAIQTTGRGGGIQLLGSHHLSIQVVGEVGDLARYILAHGVNGPLLEGLVHVSG
jgi:hypothetical protein